MAKFYLVVGSVYGAAEQVAEDCENKLTALGHQVQYFDGDDPTQLQQAADGLLLVVTSTTGSGDLPENIAPLFANLKMQCVMLTRQPYGVIGLGDSSYGETYCGGGRQADALLQEFGALAVCERLELDACEIFDPSAQALLWLEELLRSQTEFASRTA